MRSSSFPTSLISLPRTRFQTSGSSQPTWSTPSPCPFLSLTSFGVFSLFIREKVCNKLSSSLTNRTR
jgi:hypothetical protein